MATQQSNAVYKAASTTYYKQHLALMCADVKAAARVKDFGTVERVFQQFGEFMLRHPDADKAVDQWLNSKKKSK